MISQMTLIQNLSQGKENLIILIIKLHQDRYDRMGQTARTAVLINNQPLLDDREMVDMFMRENVKNGIIRGEVQVNASSSTQKRSYNGKKESSTVYGQKGRNKSDLN